jgi:CBS domain-containing protein
MPPPLDFIQSCPPFNRLSEAGLTAVVQTLEIALYPPGSHILVQDGLLSQYLYLIRRGAVRLERDEKPLQVLEEGELFGFVSLLSGHSPAFEVVTEEETELYQTPAEVFRRLLEEPAFAEFFLKGLGERLHLAAKGDRSPVGGDLTAPVALLITRPPVFVEPAAKVVEAARQMRQARISSILVNGQPPGIITDRDLRIRVLAEGLGPETPVHQIMSQPLMSLPHDTQVYHALLFMLEENIHHLPLTRQGQIVGVITDTDLLRHQSKSPLYLLKQVERIADARPLANYQLEVTDMVEVLFRGGLDVAQIGRIISTLNDTLIKRLLRLAEAELGPPPTAYAWIVFGSEGRQEQTLLTDQDNALIYQEETLETESYFKSLSERVVNGLIQAGFPPCRGGYMATKWRYSLAEWERRFKQWLETPKPEALLEAGIFFDFRPVHGELDLVPLEELLQTAGSRQLFMAHLARAALEFQPPLGFFRRIVEEEGGVDLKKGGVTPIISLARLYALYLGAPARSTLARLEAIGQAGILDGERVELLREAFRFISHLRLREQLQMIRAGQVPENRAPLKSLSALERRNLKEAFLVIRETQEMTETYFQTGRLG